MIRLQIGACCLTDIAKLSARADWKRNGRIITAGARNKNNPRQTDKANVRAIAKGFLLADWISGIIATGRIEDKILIFQRLLTLENRPRATPHQGAVRYAHVWVIPTLTLTVVRLCLADENVERKVESAGWICYQTL